VVIDNISRALFPKVFHEQTRHITVFSGHRKMKASDAKVGHCAKKGAPRTVRPHFLVSLKIARFFFKLENRNLLLPTSG